MPQMFPMRWLFIYFCVFLGLLVVGLLVRYEFGDLYLRYEEDEIVGGEGFLGIN